MISYSTKETARTSLSTQKLYELWVEVCGKYDKGEIGAYQLEEMKEVVFTTMAKLEALKRNMNS